MSVVDYMNPAGLTGVSSLLLMLRLLFIIVIHRLCLASGTGGSKAKFPPCHRGVCDCRKLFDPMATLTAFGCRGDLRRGR